MGGERHTMIMKSLKIAKILVGSEFFLNAILRFDPAYFYHLDFHILWRE